MEYILFFVNIFVVPSLIFLFSYIWQGKTTSIISIALMYCCSVIFSTILAISMLSLFNFLFSQNYVLFDLAYTVFAVLSSLTIAFVIVRFKMHLEFKTNEEKVKNEEKK